MRRSTLIALGLALAFAGTAPLPAAAQSDGTDEAAAMRASEEAATPGPEHEALAETAGSWNVTTTWWAEPDGEAFVSQGTAERTMIFGGRILEEHFSSEMDGVLFEGRGTIGYDNVTGRYWSVWFDTASTGVTLLYGQYDEEADAVIMEGDAPEPSTGGMEPLRIELRMDGPDRQVSTFWVPTPGGEMIRMMEMEYQRR